MDLQLPADLRRWVDGQVKRGRYASANDVVRTGLRLLVENERWREDARTKIEAGAAQLRAGQVVDSRELFEKLHRSLGKAGRRRKTQR